MDQLRLASAALATMDEYDVELAETPEQIREAFEVRHQVYCVERGYEPNGGGIEHDRFDRKACHVLLRHRGRGEVVGTTRVVLASPEAPHDSFPLQSVCAESFLEPAHLATTGEISRFAIAKMRRAADTAPAALMRLSLMQGIVQASGRQGLTHWCAMMERSLLRLLKSSAVHFQPAGPLVEHHGLRQPVYGRISDVLNRIHQEQPHIWDFLTASGSLWTEPARLRLAA